MTLVMPGSRGRLARSAAACAAMSSALLVTAAPASADIVSIESIDKIVTWDSSRPGVVVTAICGNSVDRVAVSVTALNGNLQGETFTGDQPGANADACDGTKHEIEVALDTPKQFGPGDQVRVTVSLVDDGNTVVEGAKLTKDLWVHSRG